MCTIYGSWGEAERSRSRRRAQSNTTGTEHSHDEKSSSSNGPKSETLKDFGSNRITGDILEHGSALERFLKRHLYREDSGEQSVRNTFTAAKSEFCDWTRTPMSVLRGEVCGKFYKVLDLKRSSGGGLPMDEETVEKRIKRAYRTKSLSLHPDKNMDRGASDAFKIVSEAYECLSDKACRQVYDANLETMESQIADWRRELQLKIKKQIFFGVSEVHYYASLFAQNFYQCKFR